MTGSQIATLGQNETDPARLAFVIRELSTRLSKTSDFMNTVLDDETAAAARSTLGVAVPLQSKLISTTRDMTAVSGNVGYTGVGFKPTALLCIGCISGLTEWSIGFSDSAKANASIGFFNTSLATSPTSAQIIRLIDSTGSNDQIAAVASYDADGFTLSWTQVGSPTGTGTLYFLCLA